MTPYRYGGGSRLSAAYTKGRDGKPCPPYCSTPGSKSLTAWKLGHAEWRAAQRKETK